MARAPTERHVFCTILGYLANKPSAACLDATAPQNFEVVGMEETERMMAEEYGVGPLTATREWSKRIAEKFIDLHPEVRQYLPPEENSAPTG